MGSRLNHHDYTVALIAVLPIEAEAALGVLDKRHEGHFESERGDDYIYVGGEVNGHNVVVATNPAGQNYGVGSAAALASQIKARFPNIWFALLVGVAAGLPNLSPRDPSKYRDIRLGDVLVSIPDKDGSGIVHYDLGRHTEEGFLPNGRAAESPTIVRAAIGNIHLIQKSSFRTGSQLAGHLADLQSSLGEHKFMCPSQDGDHLHVSRDADSASTASSQILRQPREELERTKVWYGNIGSGNSVVRNAKRRDELRNRYDLIGLEMEAAGVANILPVGVIRGVCDYGDAQKGKEWQPYAAAVAAVYAKGILRAIVISAGATQAVTTQSTPATTDSHPAVWLVPFDRTDELVGRQAALETLEATLSAPSGQRKVALTGLGGIGKSRLALEFAHRTHLQRPSCSIIWIRGTNLASFERDCLRIGQALSVPQITDAKADAKMLLKQYLSTGQAGEWLLIIDNADDRDLWTARVQQHGTSVVPLMDFIPSSHQGVALITTRDHQAAVKIARNSLVRLHELSEPEALSMIKSLLGDRCELMDVNPSASATLLDCLSYLPLALVQAAAYILENDVSCIQDYLRLWDTTEEAIVELLSEDFEADTRYPELKNPVAATWLISFEQVRKQNPQAADMLAFLACLDFKSIPESLLPLYLFGTDGVNNQMTKAIGILTGYTFLQRQKADGVNPVYDMHRLVHLATRNWLRSEGSLTKWSLEAAEHIVRVFPKPINLLNKDKWALYMPHAERICAASGPDNTEVSIELLSKIGRCYYMWGKYTKGVDALRKVVSWRSDAPDRNVAEDVEFFRYCRHLAQALEGAGEFAEAEAYAQRAVDGLMAMSGKNDSHTLRAMSTLGMILWRRGQLDKAEALQSDLLELRRTLRGEESSSTLRTMNDLAVVYSEKGLPGKAEELQLEILDIRKRISGDQHPETLTGMHNLATTYQDQHRYSEAEALLVPVVEAWKELLGEEHPTTLNSMNCLAMAYRQRDHLIAAEALHAAVLEKYKRLLGGDHPDTLSSMSQLALTWEKAGRRDEAMNLMEECLELRTQKLGEVHPSTLESLHALAGMWEETGRKDDARVLMEDGLQHQKRVLGKLHRETLVSTHGLAMFLKRTRLKDEAITLMEDCLKGRRQTLGEEHADTLSSMYELALLLKRTAQKDEAVALMKECLKGERKILGGKHSDTLTSMYRLALMLKPTDEKEAIALMAECLEGQRDTVGDQDSCTLTSMHHLAIMLHDLDKQDEAIGLMSECVRIRAAKLGENHKRTLLSKEWLDFWTTGSEEELIDDEESGGHEGRREILRLAAPDEMTKGAADIYEESLTNMSDTLGVHTPASTPREEVPEDLATPPPRTTPGYTLAFRLGMRSITPSPAPSMPWTQSHTDRRVTSSPSRAHGFTVRLSSEDEFVDSEVD